MGTVKEGRCLLAQMQVDKGTEFTRCGVDQGGTSRR